MSPPNVLLFDEKSKVHLDSRRAARLWKQMEESRAGWEELARGAAHHGRFDPKGSVAAVYAYGAHVLRRIKRKSVDALFLKEAAEEVVCEQILIELEKFQVECESAMQARAATRGVSYAITDCFNSVRPMRRSAGCKARTDSKMETDRAKAEEPTKLPSVRLRKRAAKKTRKKPR